MSLQKRFADSEVAPFDKTDCFSRDKQEAIIKVVKKWLLAKYMGYQQKYEETESDYYVGAMFVIRELLGELENVE